MITLNFCRIVCTIVRKGEGSYGADIHDMVRSKHPYFSGWPYGKYEIPIKFYNLLYRNSDEFQGYKAIMYFLNWVILNVHPAKRLSRRLSPSISSPMFWQLILGSITACAISGVTNQKIISQLWEKRSWLYVMPPLRESIRKNFTSSSWCLFTVYSRIIQKVWSYFWRFSVRWYQWGNTIILFCAMTCSLPFCNNNLEIKVHFTGFLQIGLPPSVYKLLTAMWHFRTFKRERTDPIRLLTLMK